MLASPERVAGRSAWRSTSSRSFAAPGFRKRRFSATRPIAAARRAAKAATSSVVCRVRTCPRAACSRPTWIRCPCASAYGRSCARFVVPADKTTALGADDRAGATAILVAALEIARRRLPHPPLVFLWTVQEELGLHGARFASLAMLGRPKLAFNFDGGSPETRGHWRHRRLPDADPRARGGQPCRGPPPRRAPAPLPSLRWPWPSFNRQGWHGLVTRNGGCGTSNIGVIRGGSATNVVTPEVELHAEARSHDPAFRGRIVEAIRRLSSGGPVGA